MRDDQGDEIATALDRLRRVVGQPVHRAWATKNKLSLGQVVVDEKTNEIAAIPELLRLLDLGGALAAIDAKGCQEIGEEIREGGGDYVRAVKWNQPTLYEQVTGAIDGGLERDAARIDEHRTEETGHDRQETRGYAVFPAPETVDPMALGTDLPEILLALVSWCAMTGRMHEIGGGCPD
jgi:hypothetical protein